MSSVTLQGATRPQFFRSPGGHLGQGAKAADLCAAAGQPLYPWQRHVLDEVCRVDDNGNWTAFEAGIFVPRQNGKGTVLEARELAELLLFNGKLILHSAHEVKTAMEHFRRMEALLTNVDAFRKRVYKVVRSHGDEGFEMIGGARLRIIARTRSSGRGFSGDLLVLDEAQNLTSDQTAALYPTVSARPNPQVILTGTPPTDPILGAYLFQLRKRAMSQRPGSLCYMDYGMPGSLDDLEELDLGDPEQWARANPSLGYRLPRVAVEREYDSLEPVNFARERMGVWPTAGSIGGVVSVAAWGRGFDDTSVRHGDVAIGIDVTPDRGRASMGLAARRADRTWHGEVIRSDAGVGWVVDAMVAARNVDPLVFVVDPKAGAAALLPAIRAAGFTICENREEASRGDVILMKTEEYLTACGQMVDDINEDRFFHREQGQVPLTLAALGVKWRQVGDGQAFARRNRTTDISPFVAVTVARWAHEEFEGVSGSYDALNNIF